VPNFTGRVNASEILIEFAVPLTKEIKFPVISIQNIPSNSNQLESIPPYIRNPKSTRDDPVILLTGYWPPTNEAVRPFSQNPILNPEGWIGEDWEGFGFDIVSYFPTFFPPDCESCGQGSGDLEVDYQDTSEDWWNIVDSLNPISIITFSRGYINYSWELEFKYYNWQNWIDDFTPPYQPTPSPPDQNSPPNHMRFSSLPMNEIVDAVNASDLGLNSYIDYAGGAGQYLSEFKGFHGVWYKDLMEYEEQTPCYLAGHVHVGGMIDWDTAHEAVLITVRETIQYIQENILSPGDVNQDGSINSLDINMVISHLNGTTELTENQFYYADMDEDSNITFHDVILLVNILLTQN
ncbi:MAG: dockerin type I repeat-containing protein, partial [Candidatus Marinimicrobia bacterium]|nr:dockerin type I repeat-containing protein [Candidatus Neomarinimicrobiota bacterium]